jgi:general secretion pathway protein D
LTQAQQSTTGVSNVVNNYSREDIGLTLKVKPRLSSNNKVSLEVETVLEDVDPSSESQADMPTTTKRTVKTNAIVNNGEMIILGGLIKNISGKGVSKVPFLGDIPVLGELFTHTSDVEREQNVVIYLTPYIVRKSDDLQKLKSMLSELEEVQTRYNRLFDEALEEKTGVPVEDSTVPASRRIQRDPKSNLSILEEA